MAVVPASLSGQDVGKAWKLKRKLSLSFLNYGMNCKQINHLSPWSRNLLIRIYGIST
ncbi:ARMT1 isoform 3 [Pongo abelii]|uniref:ARMT1 isoform 3 n=1 Tax=Pongo abelii TaxID=9601 RepID=A0A2J8XAD8_PONAB|nr:ARMT1 isoform 3 [Pongo abelii]